MKVLIYTLLLVAAVYADDDKPCPPGNEEQYYAHETECGLFYQCSNGQLILQECPPGLYFDIVLNVCDGNADCQNRTTSTPKGQTTTPMQTTTLKTTTTVEPVTTTTEATTTTPVPTTTTTPEPTTTTTTEPTTTQDPNPTHCDFDGFLPYPCDCTKSLTCLHGKLVVLECPIGLNFDVITDKCEDPAVAVCGLM